MKTSASRCGSAPGIQHSFSSFHHDAHVVTLLCHSCISGDKYHKQVRQGGELVFCGIYGMKTSASRCGSAPGIQHSFSSFQRIIVQRGQINNRSFFSIAVFTVGFVRGLFQPSSNLAK